MLAAYITGPKTIEVKESATPAPKTGEVLVRIRSCGICGSDLHFYEGAFPTAATAPPGHEMAGEIEAVGEGVRGWTQGDRVAIEPIISCQSCEYCRSGRYHICQRHVLIGTMQQPGGLAEYITVPAYTLYRLPDDMEFEVGALAEPLAVAVHGLHMVELRAGEKVLVLGSGTIGLMAVLAARHAGADVVATYRHDHQAEAAMRMGAAGVVHDEATSGLGQAGFDVVVETVGGTANTLQQALASVRPGGRVSLLGIFTQPMPVHPLGLVLKETTIVGGITYCRPGLRSDFDVALDILSRNGEDARSLITHRFALEDAAEAFKTAAHKSTKSLKVHVQP